MVTVTIGQTASDFWTPQVIAAFIQGGVALIAALIVGFFAWRQWKVAKEKLVLDLFDRRFSSFRRVIQAIEERISEVAQGGIDSPMTTNASTKARAFWEAKAEAGFLFGQPVRDALAQIEVSFVKLAQGKALLVERGISAQKPYYDALDEIGQFSRDFNALAQPYIQIDQIGVALPPRRLRLLTKYLRERPSPKTTRT